LLTNETKEYSVDRNRSSPKIHKRPPIYVHGVINYGGMIKQIRDTAEDEQHCTKSPVNNIIEINCVTPDIYRKLVRYCKENNIFYRTYQLKVETAYRIVIKYLLHSTDTEDIRQELSELGHNVRNTINAQQRISKQSLNLFFVDLERAEHNKTIYNIKELQNKITQTEPPRVNKNNIIKCMRCQQYGHKKSYCNKPFMCVKCGGSHNSREQKKVKKHQQNGHLAEAIIQPTTNAAKVIIT
jgi:hypothetical protein